MKRLVLLLALLALVALRRREPDRAALAETPKETR